MKRIKKILRVVFWVIWSAGWILGISTLSKAGLTYYRPWYTLAYECAKSCFFANLMAKSKFWFYCVLINLVWALAKNQGLVGLLVFIYNLLLLVLTWLTEWVHEGQSSKMRVRMCSLNFLQKLWVEYSRIKSHEFVWQLFFLKLYYK